MLKATSVRENRNPQFECLRGGLNRRNREQNHWPSRWLVIGMLLAALAALGGSLEAQVRFGTVLGFVGDSNGAAVPEATVTLTNIGTNEIGRAHV